MFFKRKLTYEQFISQKVRIRVCNSNTWRRDEVIGEFELPIASLRKESRDSVIKNGVCEPANPSGTEFHKVWLALGAPYEELRREYLIEGASSELAVNLHQGVLADMNAEEQDNPSKAGAYDPSKQQSLAGFIRVSISALGPGEQPYKGVEVAASAYSGRDRDARHPDLDLPVNQDHDPREYIEATDILGSRLPLEILHPPMMPIVQHDLVVRVFRAEDLPKSLNRDSSCDPFVSIRYAGKERRTNYKIQEYNPRWNEEVRIPFVKYANLKHVEKQIEISLKDYNHHSESRYGAQGHIKHGAVRDELISKVWVNIDDAPSCPPWGWNRAPVAGQPVTPYPKPHWVNFYGASRIGTDTPLLAQLNQVDFCCCCFAGIGINDFSLFFFFFSSNQ